MTRTAMHNVLDGNRKTPFYLTKNNMYNNDLKVYNTRRIQSIGHHYTKHGDIRAIKLYNVYNVPAHVDRK